jgi:heat shock protein HtpX
MRMNNPLRFENWRQIIIPVVMPPMLLIMLAGGAATMLSIRLARAARRSLKLGRDYVADGEAIRVTHFPEALISAIAKIAGRGAFHGSARVEGLLFDGRADHEGGSHPTATDRVDAIGTLGRELMNPARLRRDSRVPSAPAFGRRPRSVATNYPLDASGRPLERPRPPATNLVVLFLTDRETFWEWHNACVAWEEWQLNERRVIGLAPKLIIPLAAACAVALYVYWPKDGNVSRLMATFNPAEMVDIARMVNSGPFCMGPSYPDGKCPGAKTAPASASVSAPAAQIGGQAASGGGTFRVNRTAGVVDQSSAVPDRPTPPSNTIPILFFTLVVIAIVRPKLLRRIFGVVEPKQTVPSSAASDYVTAADSFERASPPWRREVHSSPAVKEFGRRKA